MVDKEAVVRILRLTWKIEQARWRQLPQVKAMRLPRLDPWVAIKLLLRPVACTVKRPHDLLADRLVRNDRHGDGRRDKYPPAWLSGCAAVSNCRSPCGAEGTAEQTLGGPSLHHRCPAKCPGWRECLPTHGWYPRRAIDRRCSAISAHSPLSARMRTDATSAAPR